MMLLNFKRDSFTLFSVLGLPASGTTVIAHLLDSVDGVACISEPFFKDYHNTYIEPFGLVDATGDAQFFGLLEERGKLAGLAMVGTKEVGIFSEGEGCRLARVLREEDRLGVGFVVLRNPIVNINSILAQRAKFPRARFMDLVETYTGLHRLIIERPKWRAVSYEHFIADPILEIGRAASGVFSIEGEPSLLPSSRNIRGDRRAWDSTRVEAIKPRANVLTRAQVSLIESSLVPKWREVVGI